MLQNAGYNMLTMAAIRHRLLFPKARIAPETAKGNEDSLRLVKPTGAGTLGGTAASPFQWLGGIPLVELLGWRPR